MENNKYVKLHSFLRMAAALIAIIVFIAMFIVKQIVHKHEGAFFTWNEAFFGDAAINTNGTIVGFIGYLFIIIGGLAGLAFVFIDDLVDSDLVKKLSFVAGGVIILGTVMTLLTGVLFRTFNPDLVDPNSFHLAAGPIVLGVLALLAGVANIVAPILEDKGL